MLTILSKKDLIDEKYLQVSSANLQAAKIYCARRRSENRTGTRGWSRDKENLTEACYDRDIYWQISRVIDPIKDPIERDKVRRRILNQLSCFKTRDGNV